MTQPFKRWVDCKLVGGPWDGRTGEVREDAPHLIFRVGDSTIVYEKIPHPTGKYVYSYVKGLSHGSLADLGEALGKA